MGGSLIPHFDFFIYFFLRASNTPKAKKDKEKEFEISFFPSLLH